MVCFILYEVADNGFIICILIVTNRLICLFNYKCKTTFESMRLQAVFNTVATLL